MRRAGVLLIAVMLISGCSTVPKTFAPVQPLTPQQFSHAALDGVLRDHVADGVVDYPAIAKDSRFDKYLWHLDRIDPNALPTYHHRLAFWINAYNAFAVKGILDGYSPATRLGKYRYFIARKYQVGGAAVNLYGLERGLLIPDFRDPRIHFAIVCASKSCPKLPSWTYEPENLDAQLEFAAKEFINDPERNRFDRNRRIAYLSMIFKWSEKGFVAHSGSLLKYVKQYVADKALAKDLDIVPYKIEFLEYDWSLNGTPYVGAS
jgi:hypothetical protein